MMDTSRSYIKMCRASKELQNPNRKLEAGDYFAGFLRLSRDPDWDVDWEIEILCAWDNTGYTGIAEVPWNPHVEAVWLPRQDQLQELLGEEGSVFNLNLLEKLPNIVFCEHGVDSWEKLWLCIYMDKAHKKIWMDNLEESYWMEVT